jgi:prepilin-type N-terminal cleavage/methylation domain-containing protein
MKMKKLRKGQGGFTLIEIVIAIAIAGLITAGITVAIMQILTINTRASNHMVAVRQVQQAGKEVSKDTLQAQTVNASGTQGFPLILSWAEWGTNQTHTVKYELVGPPDEVKKLQRTHSINGGNLTVTTVAEYIASNQTSCAPLGVLPAGSALSFTVTATLGDQSETRLYEVERRPT